MGTIFLSLRRIKLYYYKYAFVGLCKHSRLIITALACCKSALNSTPYARLRI